MMCSNKKAGIEKVEYDIHRELAYDKKLENLPKYAMLILSMKN